jgi:MFS family permease
VSQPLADDGDEFAPEDHDLSGAAAVVDPDWPENPAEPEAPRHPFLAVRNADFRRMWTATSVTQLGFWLSQVAIQWHVTLLSKGDPFWIGFLYFITLAPILLVSPVAGAIADRFDRYALLIITTAGLAITALTGGIVLIIDPQLAIPGTLVIAACLGIFIAFNGPSVQALGPSMLSSRELPSGIALQATSNNVARIVGPSIAGPLLLVFSPGLCVLLYGIAATIAACLLAYGRHRRGAVPARITRGARVPIADGLRHAAARPPALVALIMVAFAALFGSAYVSSLPAVTYGVLRGSEALLSILLAVSGVGAVAGALITSRFAGARLWTVAVRVIVMALLLLVFSLVHVLGVSIAVTVGIAALNISIMNSLNVTVQRAIDDAYRGRVMAMFIVAWGGLLPIGGLLLGLVGSVGGTPLALTIDASILAIGGIGFLLLSLRPSRPQAA